MKMIGRDDLFTKAMIDASIDNMEQLLEQGIPQDMRAWLGMMGFRVIVNYRGEVVKVEQPGQTDPDE
jgi:predicted RNA polymerase sigma factor